MSPKLFDEAGMDTRFLIPHLVCACLFVFCFVFVFVLVLHCLTHVARGTTGLVFSGTFQGDF